MTTPARVPPQQAATQLLRQYEPVVARLLERSDVSAATFLTWITNACRQTPKLWEVDPTTLLGAALRSAQVGLAPNDGRSLAWIIPRKGQATWQLGYRGVLELARRAEPGIRFDGKPVYPNDTFDVDHLTGTFSHVPYYARKPRRRDRGGDPVLWYVVAVWPDGFRRVEVVDREEVERHHGFSEQPDSVLWTRAYDAAAMRSAVINMRRWLADSPQLAAAIEADGTAVDVRDMADSDDVPALDSGQTGEVEQPETAP